MKKILFSVFALFILINVSYSQGYNTINYQGSVRNPDGSPFVDKVITLRLTIVETVQNGNSLYYEIRKIRTNAVGLYNVSIGAEEGIEEKGGVPLNEINWGSGAKFLRIEVDLNADYDFLVANTIPLASVPYAMYASQGGSSGFNYWKQQSGNETKSYDDYFTFIKRAVEPQAPTIKTISSAYTINKEDAGAIFWIDGDASFQISVATDLPVGFKCNFIQKNATRNVVTFSGVESFQNAFALAGQYAEASIIVPETGFVVLKGQLK